MSPPTDRDQVEFLTHIQRLLTEGAFVATYKFALLIALADIAVEQGDDSGAPLAVRLADIGERFIRLYWPQVAPHPTGHLLRQNTGSQAAIVNLIEAARAQYGSLPQLMRSERAWSRLRGAVTKVVKDMPILKLQTLGAEKLEFLYRNEVVHSEITLHAGVAFCLRRFHPLIEDLVRGAWVRFVRTLPANRDFVGEKTDLVAFMFGAGRNDLSIVAPILRDLQSGRCFYCESEIRDKTLVVDHFVPWARYPVDLAHNFVLADDRCNMAKRDVLAAPPHLQRWRDRNHAYGSQLANAYDERGVLHDLAASYRITSWAYGSAETAHAQVWMAGKELVPLGGDWRDLLSAL